MTKNPARRLGCIDGEDSIRKHAFFKGINIVLKVVFILLMNLNL